jgi:hypothetical protein
MAEDEKEQQRDARKIPDKIELHYLKSTHYRVVHADGVYGGVTPRGLIHVNFFSERHPIPQKVTHRVTPDSKLGDEIEREGRSGLIREVEVGAVIDVEVAKSFVQWLQEKIAIIEKTPRKD